MSQDQELKLKLDGKEWWRDGIRFECQGSGKCCTSHGEYGFVYLTPEDRRRIAAHMGLSTSTFTRRHCEKSGGVWHLKESRSNPDCQFLKGKSCGIYEARPEQCRTWPFWPEVLQAKRWKKDVAEFCPGVGKGRVWSGDEIEALIRHQVEWDKSLGD